MFSSATNPYDELVSEYNILSHNLLQSGYSSSGGKAERPCIARCLWNTPLT